MTFESTLPDDRIETFLAYSIQLETEAALRFGQLADAMASGGNHEVAVLFRSLSEYSRMHLGEAQARAGFRDVPKLRPDQFVWPDLESPETAAIWAADPLIGREQALEIALAAERAGWEFYRRVLDTTQDPEVRACAREFVDEENQHVAELKRWIALQKGRSGSL